MSQSLRRDEVVDQGAWTRGRALVFLLLVMDTTVVAVWMFVYFGEYDRVVKVVAGIWGAVMAFLAAAGWKSRATSLSSLMGLLPVRFVAAVYTPLILGALPLWIFYQFPVHRVVVTESGPPSTDRWTVVVTRGTDTIPVQRGGSSWTFQARSGWHLFGARVEGYQPLREPFRVRWLALSDHFELGRLKALPGTLRLAFNRDMSWAVFDSVGASLIRSGTATMPGPLELMLPAGRYMVRANASDASPDSAAVSVTPGDTAEAEVRLVKVQMLGTLTVRSDPSGAEIFIEGELIGSTPWSGRRAPGSYRVLVRRRSPADPRFGQFSDSAVEVAATGETVYEPTLTTITLSTLRILADSAGATYYLDHADADHLLGRVEGSSVFYVFPGIYVVVRRSGSGVTECGSVTLVAGRERVLQC